MNKEQIEQLYQLRAEFRLAVDKSGLSLCEKLDELTDALLIENLELKSRVNQLENSSWDAEWNRTRAKFHGDNGPNEHGW